MAKNEFYEELVAALDEGIDALRAGRPLTVHEVEIPDPPAPMKPREIVRLRKQKLRVSQAVFAQMLNTAPQTVHAWEQGRNRPSGAALRLLRLAERRPELLAELVQTKVTTRPAPRAAKRGRQRARPGTGLARKDPGSRSGSNR